MTRGGSRLRSPGRGGDACAVIVDPGIPTKEQGYAPNVPDVAHGRRRGRRPRGATPRGAGAPGGRRAGGGPEPGGPFHRPRRLRGGSTDRPALAEGRCRLRQDE